MSDFASDHDDEDFVANTSEEDVAYSDSTSDDEGIYDCVFVANWTREIGATRVHERLKYQWWEACGFSSLLCLQVGLLCRRWHYGHILYLFSHAVSSFMHTNGHCLNETLCFYLSDICFFITCLSVSYVCHFRSWDILEVCGGRVIHSESLSINTEACEITSHYLHLFSISFTCIHCELQVDWTNSNTEIGLLSRISEIMFKLGPCTT